MDVASAGSLAAAAIGAVLLVLTLVDLFVTIFNYDGFTFLAGRLHRLAWRTLRASARVLPERTRRGYLSLGSAGMLPLTLVWWLAVEITAFALIFLPGLDSSGFALTHAAPGIGTAFYLSGGAISSLTFGDVTPTAPLFRALVDLETVIGLATFTLALTYVIAAFDALGTLNALHGRVRRHAIEPNRPETIVARYYHGGQPEELSGLLTSLSEDLEAYDQGLRRYPVVFYFHARRPDRSIPAIFAALGDLIELLRWGLPGSEPLTTAPALLALADQYALTLDRLERSFVGPPESREEPVQNHDAFTAAWRAEAGDASIDEFRALRREASAASGVQADEDEPHPGYEQWLPFHQRRCAFLDRVRHELGYPSNVD